MEPQKFAAELIHRLEAVQRTREAEEKLEERLKRVRMVSGPEPGTPCPSWLLSYFITASGPRGSLQGLPEPPSPCVTTHRLLRCFAQSRWPAKACAPVTPAPSEPQPLVASLGCVPGRRSLGGAASLSLGSNWQVSEQWLSGARVGVPAPASCGKTVKREAETTPSVCL